MSLTDQCMLALGPSHRLARICADPPGDKIREGGDTVGTHALIASERTDALAVTVG
jgi:hypothetical protein